MCRPSPPTPAAPAPSVFSGGAFVPASRPARRPADTAPLEHVWGTTRTVALPPGTGSYGDAARNQADLVPGRARNVMAMAITATADPAIRTAAGATSAPSVCTRTG